MRIGIYAGSFDPVHTGHLGFAIAAIKTARLDRVLLLPERMPRGKQGLTHYAHRLAMLRLAAVPHPALDVLELPDRQFSVVKTLPRLTDRFQAEQLLLLLGSDAIYGLPNWPHVDRLLNKFGLIVAMRSSDRRFTIQEQLDSLQPQPPETHLITSPHPAVSSRVIREALARDGAADGLLPSVKDYSRKQWLYKHIE